MAAKRYVFGPFTDRELKIIEMRTSGIKPWRIAESMCVSRQAIYARIHVIYRKAGIPSHTAALTRWAYRLGLDEPLMPESALERRVIEPKVRRTKTRIRMNRINRAAK